MSNLLHEMVREAGTIVLLGHIHPDGDCIGTSLGLYNYLKTVYPEKALTLYLDHPAEKFSYLERFDEIRTEPEEGRTFDLCITLDSSDVERLGAFGIYFQTAKKTFCIDHHVTNKNFAAENHVVPGASSCSEVLWGLLEEKYVDRAVAECLYTGIVHDTGVFKFSSTTPRTMEIAGKLMEKGLNCAKIIDDSFYRKTYIQNQLLGRALLESILFMDGRCIFTVLRLKDLNFYGADSSDLDGIIDQLRITAGVECAIFLYEKAPQEFKVSMRSNEYVDVSKIAAYFGGGGHIRAAGCTLSGSVHDVMNNLSGHIARQMEEHDRIKAV